MAKAGRPKGSTKTKGQERASERTRNWVLIAYPDSAPSNWRDILDELHTPWVESPLHDADTNADGGEKKPHWHVILTYEGVKHYDQVKPVADSINATVPQKVANMKGLVRYMIHLDNPEKQQYEQSKIIGHGGFDVAEYFKLSATSRYQALGEMRQWVRDNDCTEFFQLFDYAADCRPNDWFQLLCDNSAYIMGEYIKSRRNSVRTSDGDM